MDVNLLETVIFIAPSIIAIYFSGASIALISLIFCISKNSTNTKYDCLAILLPLALWLALAFSGIIRKSFSDFGELLILGCTISAISIFRIFLSRKTKYASETYLFLSLSATALISISSPIHHSYGT
jgi:hypothetical protein